MIGLTLKMCRPRHSTSKTSAVAPRAQTAKLSQASCAPRECGKPQHASADVVVVNTCSVTGEADREARAFIRRANRLNPEAQIIATGCYAQRAPQELAALPGVAAVVGNSHKALAPDIALHLAEGGILPPATADLDRQPPIAPRKWQISQSGPHPRRRLLRAFLP